MAYPPSQSVSIRDGQMGLVSSATALPMIVGVTASGTTSTLYQFSDPNTLLDTLGHGPATDLALACLAITGAVLVLKTAGSVSASNGSVTEARVGSSTGEVALSGTALRTYSGQIRIKKTGDLGEAKFDYTLDGGYTYSETLIVPSGGSYVAPGSGLTFGFTAGEGPTIFETGDTFTFACTPAHYNTTDLGNAVTAFLASIGNRKIRKVAFAGRAASASAGATNAAAIATHMGTFATSRSLFGRAMVDIGVDDTTDALDDFSAVFSDRRVAAAYGSADITTLAPIPGYGVALTSVADAAFERACQADLSENLGRKVSGPLRGVRAIGHDEHASQAFSADDKIITAYKGEDGFYLVNGFLKSPVGSDYQYWDWGITVDEACETVVRAQDRWILSKLRALTDGTGRLDPRDGARIEGAVRPQLKAKLQDPPNVEGYNGHVSGLSYTVDLTNDYAATRTFRSTTRLVPLIPVEGIETVIGMTRSID